MKKTKIVCTLGPSSSSKETIKAMALAGMNVARFNMSHGDHESHKKLIDLVKEVREELKLPIAILIDTKGPEIRVRQFENGSVQLIKGQKFILTTKKCLGNSDIASVTLSTFNKVVSKGTIILLNDGFIKLKVENIIDKNVECKVVVGGKLSNNKSINIPGLELDKEYLSKVDKEDILFGIEQGADVFAISFVGCKSDVLSVRKFLEANGAKDVIVCSKIESQCGVDNLDDIIDVSDSIMVARGDLGVEIPFEKIPYVQKLIIDKCLKLGKPVITATEMLESMTHNLRPTRAEISDVANAVEDGSSLVMLSGETSAGENPVLSVQTMASIVEESEKNIKYKNSKFEESNNVSSSIGFASCELAQSLKAKAIVVVTNSGFAGKSVSRFRPACPIIACTPNKKVFNQLAFYWGVNPVMDNEYSDTDNLLRSAREKAFETKLVKKGDLVVQTASIKTDKSGSNLLVVEHI